MRRASEHGPEQLDLHPFRIAHRFLRSAPETVGPGAEADPSVFARIYPLRVDLAPNTQASKRRRFARLMRIESDIRPNHAGHREPLAHIDMLPVPTGIAAI